MTTVRYTTINGEVIAEKRNGVRRLYVPDPLGSTVALLDNTQTQVDTFSYWPYGEVRTSTGTTPPPFQFVGITGYYTDGVGRTYVRARYLDTQKGRWLTQDPISIASGDHNLFRYTKNNPQKWIDPTGLSWCCFYVFGHRFGTCCSKSPQPPRKPRPFPHYTPGPWSPPFVPPVVPPILVPPYCSPQGMPVPMAACQTTCHATLCPGPIAIIPAVCDTLCNSICDAQLHHIHSSAGNCHYLEFQECLTCCEQLDSAFGQDVCALGCKGG